MVSLLGTSALYCGAPLVHWSRSVQSVGGDTILQRSVHVGKVGVRRLERNGWRRLERGIQRRSSRTGWGGSNEIVEPLDLTEENVEQVLLDARSELLQLFDVSVGITGVVQLVELDGPFVKLRLTGRFWHERSMVLARIANYLQKRIPEILEVEIEDESQLDDSAEVHLQATRGDLLNVMERIAIVDDGEGSEVCVVCATASPAYKKRNNLKLNFIQPQDPLDLLQRPSISRTLSNLHHVGC